MRSVERGAWSLRPIMPPSVVSSVVTLHAPRSMHSALRRAEISAQNGRVGVNTAVTEEGPIPPRILDDARVAAGDEDGRLGTRFGQDAPERVADERMAEKLETVRAWLGLEADAIG